MPVTHFGVYVCAFVAVEGLGAAVQPGSECGPRRLRVPPRQQWEGHLDPTWKYRFSIDFKLLLPLPVLPLLREGSGGFSSRGGKKDWNVCVAIYRTTGTYSYAHAATAFEAWRIFLVVDANYGFF